MTHDKKHSTSPLPAYTPMPDKSEVSPQPAAAQPQYPPPVYSQPQSANGLPHYTPPHAMHDTTFGQATQKRNTFALLFDWCLIVVFTLQLVNHCCSAFDDYMNENHNMTAVIAHAKNIAIFSAIPTVLAILVSGTLTESKAQIASLASQIGLVLNLCLTLAYMFTADLVALASGFFVFGSIYATFFFLVTWTITAYPKSPLAQGLLPYPPRD